MRLISVLRFFLNYFGLPKTTGRRRRSKQQAAIPVEVSLLEPRYLLSTQPPIGTSNNVTVAENTPYTFHTGDFGFTDPNNSPANNLAAVKISTLPAAGTLTDNGTAVTSQQFVTVADISAGKLVFTPATNVSATSYTSFTFQVESTGSTTNGGVNTDPSPKSLTINVSSLPVTAGAETGVNTFTTSNQSNPSIASDAAGDSVIAWQSSGQTGTYGIYAQRYNSSGVTQGSNFLVSTVTTNGNQIDPKVAMDPAGAFVITWQSSGTSGGVGPGVYAQLYNASGSAVGGPITVSPVSTKETSPSVAMDSMGDFVIAWQHQYKHHGNQYYDIEAQRYTPAGAATGSMLYPDSSPAPQGDYYDMAPSVAMDSTGDFVVAWQSSNYYSTTPIIKAQRYNSAGAQQGSNLVASTYTSGNQKNPAVAMDAWGDFVVTWESFGQDGSGYGVYAQRYNALGAAQGSQFRANTATVGYQRRPSVSMDAAGDFAIAWESFSQDGSNYGVYTQSYTSAGAPQGSETRVNTTTTGNQELPAIGMNSTGNYVAAWESNGQDGSGYGIYSQRYSVAPTSATRAPVGASNTIVTLSTSTYAYKTADFGFTDPNNTPANSLAAVEITTLPTAGTLTDNGTAVAVNQFVSAADISAGNLVYTPPANANGSTNASFTFQVQSTGSTANGGVNVDPTARTMTMNILAPAVITGLSTSSGTTLGGTSVTITGSGFTQVSAVMFGGSLATSYTALSPTSITAVAPAHTAGTVDVTIVNSLGTSGLIAADHFSYQTPVSLPMVTHVTPGTETTSGGDTITITGTNFTGATAVNFGTTPAASFTVTSPTTITAVAPAHVSGNVDVTVTTAGGTSVTNSNDQLLFTVPVLVPVVTNLSSSSGSTAGGASVNIMGVNFTNITQVNFGGLPATSFVLNSPTSITAIAPAESAGAVDVTVTNTAGTSGTSSSDRYTFVSPAPVVTQLSVSSGSTDGGTALLITGTNFMGLTGVFVGGVPATSFALNSPTSISAVVPATATAGAVDITVQTANGTSATSTVDQFTYVTPPPSVSGLSVSSGLISGGTSVTISGTHLSGATGVSFGGVAAASFTVNADGTVTAISPASAPGAVDITVTTAAGTSSAMSADRFTFINPIAIVTGISVPSGVTGGGTTVTISGSHFVGATSVLFGTIHATTFSIASDGSITAVAPIAPVGTVNITVVNASGTSATSVADQFTYQTSGTSGSGSGTGSNAISNLLALPVITDLDTSSGSTAGGNTVTLSGIGFSAVTGVMFGSVAATSYVINSDQSITAVTPAEATGVVNLILQTAAGTSTPSTSSQFTFMAPNTAPTVSALTIQPGGSTTAGTEVTIQGSNFTGATTVTFGTATAEFSVESPTTILATIPSGAVGTLNVYVTTGAGTSASIPADEIIVAPPTPLTQAGPIGTTSNTVASSSSTWSTGTDTGSSTGGWTSSSVPYPTGTGSSSGSSAPISPYSATPGNVASYGPSGNYDFTTGVQYLNVPSMEAFQIIAVDSSDNTLGLFNSGPQDFTAFGSDSNQSLTTKTIVNVDGSVLTTVLQTATSDAYTETQTGGAFGTISFDMTSASTTTITTWLQAGDGTGYLKVLTTSNVTSWEINSVGTNSSFLVTSVTTDTNLDNEFGIGPQGSSDRVTNDSFESDRALQVVTGTQDWTNASSLVPYISTTATDQTTGFDSYFTGETNTIAKETYSNSLSGQDSWGQSGTFDYSDYLSGKTTIAIGTAQNETGSDSYDDTDTNSTITSPSDPNGTETVNDTTVSTDTGNDRYSTSNSTSILYLPDGTITSPITHFADSDSGNELLTIRDYGTTVINEIETDGSIVTAGDNFSDTYNDSSTYTDSDSGSYGSAVNGGSGTFTSTTNDNIVFNSSDSPTVTASYIDPNGAVSSITDTSTSTDTGQESDSTTMNDAQTLTASGAGAGDSIAFIDKIDEQDQEIFGEVITASTNGHVAPGEVLNANETFTISAGTSTNSDNYSDIGNGTLAADGSGTESDTATDATTTTDAMQLNDLVTSSDTQANPDGSSLSFGISNNNTDSISGNSSGVTVDSTTSTFDASGNILSSVDINSFDETDFGQDQYQYNDTVLPAASSPLTGGAISLSTSINTDMTGVEAETDTSIGGSNSSVPTSVQETDTSVVTNTDTGTTLRTDALNANVTDPTTGLITTIRAGDTITDRFTDSGSFSLTGGVAAGVTTPVSITGSATTTESISGSGTDSIEIAGSVATNADFHDSEQLAFTFSGSDSITVTVTPTSPGVESAVIQFGTTLSIVTTGGAASSLAAGSATSDAQGNAVGVNESETTASSVSIAATNTDSGEEDSAYSNNQQTADTESDTAGVNVTGTTTVSSTTTAHNTSMSVNPTTGLITKLTYDDNGSTDVVSDQISASTQDLHSSSLGATPTDVVTGGSTDSRTDKLFDEFLTTASLVGADSQGNQLNLSENVDSSDMRTVNSTITGTLLASGVVTNVNSSQVSATGQVSTSIVGTVSNVAPSTGVVSAMSLNDQLNETLLDSASTVGTTTGTTGTSAGVPNIISEDGSDTQATTLNETLSQTNSNGSQTAAPLSLGNSFSVTETSTNGVLTNPVLVDTTQSTPMSSTQLGALNQELPSRTDLLSQFQKTYVLPATGQASPLGDYPSQLSRTSNSEQLLVGQAKADPPQSPPDNNGGSASGGSSGGGSAAGSNSSNSSAGLVVSGPASSWWATFEGWGAFIGTGASAAAEDFFFTHEYIPNAVGLFGAGAEVAVGGTIFTAGSTVTIVTGGISSPLTLPGTVVGGAIAFHGVDGFCTQVYNMANPDNPMIPMTQAAMTGAGIDPAFAAFHLTPWNMQSAGGNGGKFTYNKNLRVADRLDYVPNNVAPNTPGGLGLKDIIKQASGWSPGKAGDYFGWVGRGVTKSAKDFTKADLLKNGFTKDALEKMAEAYEAIAKMSSSTGNLNPSAASRAAQLREILKELF